MRITTVLHAHAHIESPKGGGERRGVVHGAVLTTMAFQGDVKNRRNILQGLQQTKSRLQRLLSDSPSSGSGRSSLYPSSHQRGSPAPVPGLQSSGVRAALTPGSRLTYSSPSPSDFVLQQQQQKVLLQQVSSQSFSFFISQPSIHGNTVMPVLPRFDSNGQLDSS
ncbi:hypothetical protein GBAR_LOCUS13041 [Geodia barretti]|uniref:Uncharacterized protein n=1 Tax=Geodia barretti TaxID=519541 RepID=A0AA35S2D4_GEOBA|nr:hypothetical protein GBAR_LOCUS13041 [Geodia barretti]